MLSLMLETKRCFDGLTLDADAVFRPVSDRREPVRVITASLADDLVVLDFINAGENVTPFLSRYTAGSAHDRPLTEGGARFVAEVIKSGDSDQVFMRRGDGPEVDYLSHLSLTRLWQAGLRKRLIALSGPDQARALATLAPFWIDLKAIFGIRDGKPEMHIRCGNLLDFMRLEIAMVALEGGAKPVECEHCHNFFLPVQTPRAEYTPSTAVTVAASQPCARERRRASNVNPQADLEVYETEQTAWVVDYVDQHGKRRLKTFTLKKDAEAWATNALHEVSQGLHAPNAKITIEETIALWIKHCLDEGLERGTIEQREQHLTPAHRSIHRPREAGDTDHAAAQCVP